MFEPRSLLEFNKKRGEFCAARPEDFAQGNPKGHAAGSSFFGSFL